MPKPARRLGQALQARAVQLDAKAAAARHGQGAAQAAGVGGDATPDHSQWVPVLDVFSSAALSDSEEAFMRRVIASRVAPAPSISYTRRPL